MFKINSIIKQIIIYGFLIFIIYFAGVKKFAPFDADHAIQIIMAKNFNWEMTDFFYWGQTRLGSLMPVILIFPISLLPGYELEVAVLICIFIYIIAIRLLINCCASNLEKIFAYIFLLLLPPGVYDFFLFTGHPYLLSLLLILWMYNIEFAGSVAYIYKGEWRRSVLAGLVIMLSMWVSESNIAAVLALLTVIYGCRLKLGVKYSLHRAIVIIGAAVLSLSLVFWVRFQIGNSDDYGAIASLSQVTQGLKRFFELTLGAILIKNNPAQYTYAWYSGCLVNIIFLASNFIAIINFLKYYIFKKEYIKLNPVVHFLAFNNFYYFALVLMSSFSYFGEAQIQHYFVIYVLSSLYIFSQLCATFCIKFDYSIKLRYNRFIISIVISSMLVTILSMLLIFLEGVSNYDYKHNKHLRDAVNNAKLQSVKLIYGDYWNSLPINVLSSFEILSFPEHYLRMQSLKFKMTDSNQPIYMVTNKGELLKVCEIPMWIGRNDRTQCD